MLNGRLPRFNWNPASIYWCARVHFSFHEAGLKHGVRLKPAKKLNSVASALVHLGEGQVRMGTHRLGTARRDADFVEVFTSEFALCLLNYSCFTSGEQS